MKGAVLFCFVLGNRDWLYSVDMPRTCHVIQARLKFPVLLSQPPEYWDYRNTHDSKRVTSNSLIIIHLNKTSHQCVLSPYLAFFYFLAMIKNHE